MRVQRLPAALSILVLTTIVACSSGSDSGDSSSSKEVDPNGELIFFDNASIESFDPTKNTTGRAVRWLYPVFDRLLHLNVDGEIEPGLAESWDYPEDNVLELRLREGVEFHDGSALDAQAVKANLERTKSLVGVEAQADPVASVIESVEPVEPTLVRINLTEPNRRIIFSLASTLGMMMSPASLKSPDLETKPVGAGMFTLAEFQPGERAVYERFDGYWDQDAVKLATLVLQNVPDSSTRLNALRSGQVDLTFLDVGQVKDAEAAGLTVEPFDTIQVYTMFTRVKPGTALENKQVRQAINYAIDRKAIVDSVLFGIGKPTVQIYPEGYFPYNPKYGPEFYEYDPEKARSLLASAGVTVPPLTFLVFNRPEEIQVMEIVQSQLKDVGIEVKLEPIEPTRFDRFTVEDCCDVMAGNRSGGPDPLESLAFVFGPDGVFHPGGVESEGLQPVLDKIAALEPGEERTKLLQEASGLTVEDPVAFPLFARTIPYASQEDCVVGFRAYRNGIDEYRNVGVRVGC